ncbi:MAG: PorT family protein [Bacteroidetes bacterium]|nr:PorT family protein [Bacteroidota bacterium]
MKNALLIFLFTIITATSKGQFYFGPQAGIGVATLKGTEIEMTNQFAYHGGLMFNIPITHHISIMTGGLYSSKGFKYDYVTQTRTTQANGSGGTDTLLVETGVKADATLGYLDIPIMLTYYLGDQGGFFIQAGPQFSYLLTSSATVTASATYSVVSGTSTAPAPAETTTDLEFNKSDLSLIGGIGYKLPSFLLVYARATTGFMKVIDGDYVADENAGENFTIEVGVGLTLGGK